MKIKCIMLSIVLSANISNASSQVSTAIVDINKVVASLNSFKYEQIKLLELSDSLKNQIDNFIIQYDELNNWFQIGHPRLALVKEKSDSIKIMEKLINDSYLNMELQINKERERIQIHTKSIIKEFIKPFCNKYEIKYMFEKEFVLFCIDCNDYSEKLIQYINEN